MSEEPPALPLAHLPPEHGYRPKPQVACHVWTGQEGEWVLGATLSETGELQYHDSAADLLLYFMENCKGGELLLHGADRVMLHFIPHFEQMARAGFDSQLCVNGLEHIIYVKINRADKKRGTWRIRDTHAVLPMPLEELGVIAERPTPELGTDLRAFLSDTCQLILQAYQNYSKIVRRQWQIGPARTSGSTALKSWKRRLNPEAAHWRQRGEVERLSREAYVGGLTWYADTKLHADCAKIDVNAMYASVMRDIGVPTGLASGTDHFVEDEPGIYHVRFTCPSDNPFPCVPVREGIHVKYPHKGTYETVVPSITMELAIRHGYIFEVIWGFVWERMDYLFTEWVGECEAVELGAYGRGYKKVIKGMRNSLAGKFGQRPVGKSYVITDNPSDDMTPTIGLDGVEIDYLWYTETDFQQPHIQPHWAAWITAAARAVLVEAVYAIGPEVCLYGDTDSIVAPYEAIQRAGLPIGAGYGQWKVVCEYKQFVALYGKTYIGQHYDGSWELKHSGIPQETVTPDQIAPLLRGETLSVIFPSLPKAIKTVGGGSIAARTIAKSIGAVYNKDRWDNGPPVGVTPHE